MTTAIFKDYKGKWVALEGDFSTVISSGNDIIKVRDEAAKKGFNKPVLFRVPKKSIPFIG